MAIKEIVVGQRFLALQSDDKPLEGVSAGATLKELDTLDEYVFDGDSWILEKAKSKKYEWLNIEIGSNNYFIETIPCEAFDMITGFVSATGNVQISFRVTKSDGEDYSWDALGIMNEASIRNSSQGSITGIPYVKVIVTNDTAETVTADIYIYLGRKG